LRKRREARGAHRHAAVYLEARLRGRMDGGSAEIAVALVPWTHVDRVRARAGVHCHERAAHSQVLFLDGLNFRHDVWASCHDWRRLRRVDFVRRREVEIHGEECGAAARDHELVAIREPILPLAKLKSRAKKDQGRRASYTLGHYKELFKQAALPLEVWPVNLSSGFKYYLNKMVNGLTHARYVFVGTKRSRSAR